MSTNSFDERAATWDDDPDKRERARRAAVAIRDAVALQATDRMLEYGAGTALVSQALQESVGPLTLVDSSAGMREVLEQKIAAGAIDNARVWDLDLAVDPPPDDEFDLVVTVMTLHHVPDIALVVSRFKELLADGGHLCVVDLVAEDGSFHGHDFHGHEGFDLDEFADMLSKAGFTVRSIERYDEVMRNGRPYPLFLATATPS